MERGKKVRLFVYDFPGFLCSSLHPLENIKEGFFFFSLEADKKAKKARQKIRFKKDNGQDELLHVVKEELVKRRLSDVK